MSTIQKVQLFFHSYFLKNQLMKRMPSNVRKAISNESAETIGILFNATDLDNRNIVEQYAKKLKGQGKKVKLLGFFDNKMESEHYTFPHFNRKKIDWALRPTGPDVQSFIKEPFDILINVDTETQTHSEYIAALSQACLRVGPYTQNTFCYDLMIDTKKANDLRFFIRHIEQLLEKTTKRYETTQI